MTHDHSEAMELAQEIVKVEIPQKKGEPKIFLEDEFVKPDTTLDKLAKLRPAFKKEGELTFPKIQKKISIEIADNDAETTQGLMYRKSMPDTCGMLFVFPDSQERSFWMKNTFIPLDLLFINSNKEVITIQPNRPPFSEEAIPSYKPAQYVLEVNAGFCQRNGIKQGDKISF